MAAIAFGRRCAGVGAALRMRTRGPAGERLRGFPRRPADRRLQPTSSLRSRRGSRRRGPDRRACAACVQPSCITWSADADQRRNLKHAARAQVMAFVVAQACSAVAVRAVDGARLEHRLAPLRRGVFWRADGGRGTQRKQPARQRHLRVVRERAAAAIAVRSAAVSTAGSWAGSSVGPVQAASPSGSAAASRSSPEPIRASDSKRPASSRERVSAWCWPAAMGTGPRARS